MILKRGVGEDRIFLDQNLIFYLPESTSYLHLNERFGVGCLYSLIAHTLAALLSVRPFWHGCKSRRRAPSVWNPKHAQLTLTIQYAIFLVCFDSPFAVFLISPHNVFGYKAKNNKNNLELLAYISISSAAI